MSASARVFDCFTFATELDLLEFRLNLLSPVVHRFVIVEAPRTHSGLDKPLLFRDNRHLFERYLDQIIHVVVDDLPAPVPDRWVPETFQRDAILRGLVTADPDDIALVTDVDEIPDPQVVERLRHETFTSVALEMRMSFYRGNWQSQTPWPLARATRVGILKSPSDLRTTTPLMKITDAGTHVSYLMDPADIVRKYTWFAHSELDDSIHRSQDHIEAMVGLGILAPTGEALTVCAPQSLSHVQRELLNQFPQYFRFDVPPEFLRRVGAAWRRLRSRSSMPHALVRRGDALLLELVRHRKDKAHG